MTIEFQCGCGQAIAVPDAMGGKKGKCPRCGNILDVPFAATVADPYAPPPFIGTAVGPIVTPPAPPATPEPPVAAPASPAPEKDCPVCGERIKAAAVKCRFCGEFLGAIRPVPGSPPVQAPAFDGLPREVAEVANVALVLGILSVTLCPMCGPFAVWKGNEARSLARMSSYESPASANAGLVLGWMGSALVIFVIVVVVVWLVVWATP